MTDKEKSPVIVEETVQEDSAAARRAVRKLDMVVLPLAAMVYLLNFLDRSNIGNAKVAGLATDLHLTPRQYLTCVTATYILYIVWELPSNLLLKRIGAHIMIPAMCLTWATVSCLTGLVQNFGGLFVARLILGLCEGGLFPGLILYLSMFYRRRELQTRISAFFASASLSGAFSGLLAAAIVNLDGKGGQAGWRWIFYLEGLFTALFGIGLFFVLPRDPQGCKFLTQEERNIIDRRLAADVPKGATVASSDRFSWREFPSPWIRCALKSELTTSTGMTLYALAYFTPPIVQTFGYSPVQTQLLTVPPFACAFLVTLLTAWISDRSGQRGLCAIAMSVLALVGYIMFYKSLLTSVRYVALFLAITGVYSTAPALCTWISVNSAGHYRKSTAVALGFIATNSGGIASTWLFPQTGAPAYATASKTLIAMTVLVGVFSFLNIVYLRYANGIKARRRDQNDEAEYSVEGDRHPDFIYNY
ncbi:uncharacterized protein JCM15063_001891 [Sporobolomyces koalae]|uniref:uncharacterized protein n=1 Tax=Sporobolomyces koalae TaxID=500713 RepID=UPI00316DDD7D